MTFWQNRGKKMWLFWVAAQIGSAAAISIISKIQTATAGTDYWAWRPFVFSLVWLLLGAIPGIAEMLVLRKYIQIPGWWWVFTTIVGKGIADQLTIQWYVNSRFPVILESFIGALIYGIVIGFLQWLVLRNKINNAGWWIILLIFGGFLSNSIGQTLNAFFSPLLFVLSVISTAVVYGGLTGAGLVVLLRQPLREDNQVSSANNNINNLFRRLTSFLSGNIPGLALLIWTLLLILVSIDGFASVSHGLFFKYPIYSLIVWPVIGAFTADKVWETIKLGLIGHIINFCILFIISTTVGDIFYVWAIVALLIFVGIFALLSSVVVLVSSWIANRIRIR